MTKIDDMPKALANGTLTSCRACGRMAIFAEPNKKSTMTQDIWTCACTTENSVPTRGVDVSTGQRVPGSFAASTDQTKEGSRD